MSVSAPCPAYPRWRPNCGQHRRSEKWSKADLSATSAPGASQTEEKRAAQGTVGENMSSTVLASVDTPRVVADSLGKCLEIVLDPQPGVPLCLNELASSAC